MSISKLTNDEDVILSCFICDYHYCIREVGYLDGDKLTIDLMSPITYSLKEWTSTTDKVIIRITKINNSNFECLVKVNYDPGRKDNINYEYNDSSLSIILNYIKSVIK